MEESSDARMETDVSSTTDDVPESQEVTASQGQVEMVIVVENVNEDGTNSTMECDDPPQNAADDTVTSNKADEQPKSPAVVKISPLKTGITKPISTMPGSPVKTLKIISPIKMAVVECRTSVQQAEPADSSTKVETTISSGIENQESDAKTIEVQKTTPVKEITVTEMSVSEQPIPQQDKQKKEAKAQDNAQQSSDKDPETLNINMSSKPSLSEEDKDNVPVKSTTSPLNDSVVEPSTDSQASSDVSEKEHKSISRELKSLINSAKESKIISECTQLTSKTRKSRSNLDTSNTSLNASVEADRIQGNRRGSNNSQISNCSEKSEKMVKRSMRSQNPEFVSKCKQFLNSVTGKITDEDPDNEEVNNKSDSKIENTGQTPNKKKKVEPYIPDKMSRLRSDPYCWRCHWAVEQEANEKAHPPVMCTVCPRSFHFKCLSANERKVNPEKNWVCPDCLQILQAESSETRSPSMKKITLGMLCELLKYALERVMELNGVEPFIHPVDRTLFPDYDKYVVHPMDLTQMKQNIADGNYGSTEAFIADAQWILHNSIIFNTLQSKLTAGARALVRWCRAEAGEIEACAECYAGAHARRATWFTDVCSTPHVLLWAKLKGFPYWPAKGMTVNAAGLVDVRFFGAHDRAWVPAKDCFLYSEKDPNNFRSKRQDILDSMQEAEEHIRNISRKYGKFVYPPFKTQFDPSKLTEQVKMMIPSFEGEIKTALKEKTGNGSPVHTKNKKRSSSKSSKSSANDDETSECDDSLSATVLSNVDTNDTSTTDKNKTDVDTSTKLNETDLPSRKRRRSNLEEAVLTVMETPDKRKKSDEKSDKNDKETSNEDSAKTDTDAAESLKISEPKDKVKEAEPSSSTDNGETQRVTPIKLVALPRSNKQTPKQFTTTKVTTRPSPKASPKIDDKTPQKTKQTKADKSLDKSQDKTKPEKRRNSRNRSIVATSTPKTDKKDNEASTSKETKQYSSKKKDGDNEKSILKSGTDSPKPNKSVNFDDDTTLAVLARETRSSTSGLPTISCVRSLSTTAQSTSATITTTTINAKTIEVSIETNSGTISTSTRSNNVRVMSEAVNKSQKGSDNEQPQQSVVGRVGVRAFARMTSPNRNEDVQVEIKAEPFDLEEADEDRRMEKMDLMNACKLRPVNPSVTQNLRDVRINKVVVTPSVVVRRPPPSGKGGEIRAKAKKTFPQPKRADEGRSELNGKNSMVYIPIQPPMTQAPVRGPRPPANGPAPAGPRPAAPCPNGNNQVNTVTSPLRPTLSTPPTSAVVTTSTSTLPSPGVAVSTVGQTPTVGQVPTTVHTVPLMTSVNGHWMFSLQPVMSVGCVDGAITSPVVNGLPDRAVAAPIVPLNNNMQITPTTPSQNRSNDTNTPAELPKLQQRPVNPLDPTAPVNILPAPSSAGTLTTKLNQSAVKMADFFRNLLEDCIEKLEDPVAQATAAKLQLEQIKWKHQQEIEEIRHNHELTLSEMRLTFEKEKIRAISEIRRAAQFELETTIKATKSKQWCANCGGEAQFYCCWNTCYCDYPCQRTHWAQHHAHCAQRKNKNDSDSSDAGQSESRLQTDKLPVLQKNVPSQSNNVSGKLTSTRVYAAPDTNASPKSSIIMSMVEDNTGNQTMKCVGTYKSSNPTQILLNKQMANEESNTAKKVVTSGGYLIVGASGNNTSVVTPASAGNRRAPAVQYYT